MKAGTGGRHRQQNHVTQELTPATIAALLKIVVSIIVGIAVVLVFALVYNSFYFSSEPLLMTSEHGPRPFLG